MRGGPTSARSRAITGSDAEELEDHLREQIASLGDGGLSEDEAFLVAVKRMGAIDALTREFAREHSDRLWKQLVLSGDGGTEAPSRPRPTAPGRCGSPSPWRWRRAWRSSSRASSGSTSPTPARSTRSTSASSPFPSSPRTSRGTGRFPRSSRMWLAAVFALAAIVVNAFPFSPSPGADTAGPDHYPPAHRALAGRRRGLRRRTVAGERPADGFRPLHRRALHLLRPDRPGRRRAHRSDLRASSRPSASTWSPRCKAGSCPAALRAPP